TDRPVDSFSSAARLSRIFWSTSQSAIHSTPGCFRCDCKLDQPTPRHPISATVIFSLAEVLFEKADCGLNPAAPAKPAPKTTLDEFSRNVLRSIIDYFSMKH